MALADILEYEQVTVLDIDNGAASRPTPSWAGPARCASTAPRRGSCTGRQGDRHHLRRLRGGRARGLRPTVVHVDAANRVIDEASARLDAELTLSRPT